MFAAGDLHLQEQCICTFPHPSEMWADLCFLCWRGFSPSGLMVDYARSRCFVEVHNRVFFGYLLDGDGLQCCPRGVAL